MENIKSRVKFSAVIVSIITLFAALILVVACSKPVKSIGVA